MSPFYSASSATCSLNGHRGVNKKRIQPVEGTVNGTYTGHFELSKHIRGAWFSDGLWLHMDGHSGHRQAQPMHYSTIARLPTDTAGKFLRNFGFPAGAMMAERRRLGVVLHKNLSKMN